MINEIQRAQNKANAFCHFSIHKQSHCFSLSNSTLQNQYYSNNNNSTSHNTETFSNSNKSNLFICSSKSKPTPSYSNPYSHYSNPRFKINVVTSNKPNFNTYNRPMVKRARKPNKRTRFPSTSNTPISVATQTDKIPPSSNNGQGWEPIDETIDDLNSKMKPLPIIDSIYREYLVKNSWLRPP